MLRRFSLLCILLLLFSGTGRAEKVIRVGVAPFTIYSQEDLSYLSQGIQDMLGGQLLQRGFEVVSQAELNKVISGMAVTFIDESAARSIGRSLGLDYLIYGSLTKVGQRISLDARIVDTLGLKKTIAAFVQEEGLENLQASTEKLALKVTVSVSGRQKIARIIISGNKRIETDAIKRVIQSQEGDIFSEATVSADLKRIYKMNFFEDVKVDVEDRPEGKIVRFIVDEKASIQRIEFRGNILVEEEELIEVLGYKIYAILDPKKLADSVKNLNDKYREKGYYNARITYKVRGIGPKQVSVRYDISEGERLYIQKIEFIGNKSFSDRQLKKQMETSEKGLFSWVTDSGILKKDEIRKDMAKLTEFYLNRGYIRAKVGEPQVKVEPKGLLLTIAVEEGPQFKRGKVTLSGDLIEPEETIRKKMKIFKEEYFNREAIRKDVRTIRAMYADRGYAAATVTPMIKEHDDTQTVDVDFRMDKKRLVYFERITIVGNRKTRDNVIRRELLYKEGDLFSAGAMKDSNLALQRLGYFSDINFIPSKGSAEDRMNVRLEVKERPTGAFSLGMGYSSFNQLFGLIRLSQSNLFGKGQRVKIDAVLGNRATEYTFSFTEPWLYNKPLAVGFDIYNRRIDYEDYDKNSSGLALRAGYPIMKNVRLSGRFRSEESEISNVRPNAPLEIQVLEGDASLSSILGQLRRNTTNRYFNPTEGSDAWVSVEYAGGFLGGTSYFTRYIADGGKFWPLPWGDEHTFFLRGRIGLVTKNEGGELPAYEKFGLGGINSLRGYQWWSVGPRDPVTGIRLGGEKMALFNIEYLFPLIKDAGVVGVVFFDQGNAWREDENWDLGNMRQSYGAGMRYYSPLGPLRLEWGRVVDPRPWEDESSWEFSVGTFF